MMEVIAGTAKTATLAGKIGKWVVERWSTYRRDQFLEALQEGLQIEQASGQKNETVDQALDFLLESEENSETLFEAYRRVCFARSKNYGPRIIGILTAELLNNSMNSADEEESIFVAAETLSDVQLVEFRDHFKDLLAEFVKFDQKSKKLSGRGNTIEEKIEFSDYQLGGESGSKADLLSLSLRESHGSWASLLEGCGILIQSTTQQISPVYKYIGKYADPDGHQADDIRLSSKISYEPSALRLYKLLLRARGEADVNTQIFPLPWPSVKTNLEGFFGSDSSVQTPLK